MQVIEAYLSAMKSQWDWLLGLAKCLEQHLHDSMSLKQFMEVCYNALNIRLLMEIIF